MMSVRNLAPTLVAFAVVLVGLPPALAVASATEEPVVVIDGKGNGHGVGLSQDGALAMGRSGSTADEILTKFYPGTDMATAGGPVGVRVLESADRSAEVAFPGGGEVRASVDGPQPDGFPVRIRPGETVTVSLRDGEFHAEPDDDGEPEMALPAVRLIAQESPAPAAEIPAPTAGAEVEGEDDSTTTTTVEPVSTTTTLAVDAPTTTTTVVDPPVTTSTTGPPDTTVAPAPADPPAPGPKSPSLSADGLWLVPGEGSVTALSARGRAYRGVVEVSGSTVGGLLLVNHLDVEDYLRGMGEVLDPSWPSAALQAQAVAARTYALRATRGGGTLCDDDRCQVYLGSQAEYQEMDEAVAESAGQVLAFHGGLASTVYSASAGGVTATPQEGFGTDGSDYPYLTSGPYPASDPPVWSASIALSDLGRRLDYPGRVREVFVSAEGPSGRVLEVALEGDAGQRTVDGLRFASRMRLDSTLFSLRAAIGTPTAPPAPARGSIQAPPDAVGSLPALLDHSMLTPAGADVSNSGRIMRSALLLAAAGLLLIQSRRRQARSVSTR